MTIATESLVQPGMVHVPPIAPEVTPEITAIRLAWEIRNAVEDRFWGGVLARSSTASEQHQGFLSECLAQLLADRHEELKAIIAGRIARLAEKHPALVPAYVEGREG